MLCSYVSAWIRALELESEKQFLIQHFLRGQQLRGKHSTFHSIEYFLQDSFMFESDVQSELL